MRKKAVLLLGVISILLNGVVGCVEEVRPPSTEAVVRSTPPPAPIEAPTVTTKADLVEALKSLRDAMLMKTDWDIDDTALAFTMVKDYWRAKRWADIIRAPLRVLENTISLLARASDLKSLAEEIDEELIKAKATCQVLATVMMVQGLQEVGGKLYYGLHGPPYVSAIESMLDAADATTVPPFGFSEEHYKNVIENHLFGVQGEPVVKIPRYSTEPDRRIVEFANGALELRTSIDGTFDKLIADIEAGELPEGFPCGEVVAEVTYLEKQVLKSTLRSVDVVYKTHFSEDARTTLGAVADRKEAWRIASGNLAKKLDIEIKVELLQAGNAILLTTTYMYPGVSEIRTLQQVTTLAATIIKPYTKTFHTDPEEAFYMLPQEMVLTLPMELSNLWMIADDTNQYLRHLLVAPPPAPRPIPPHKGGIAYVAAEDDLWVIDASDPVNPHKIGHCGTPYSAQGVFASGFLAYLADGYADLRVLDVSDPSQPKEVGHSDIPKGALDVFVTDSYAYVVDRGGFLHVIEISNPARPREIGYYDAGGGLNVFISGSYAYVATGNSLRMIDVSDPSNPHEVGHWGYLEPFLYAFDVHVSNGVAYVVALDRLWVIDASDPANPHEVGELDMPRLLSALESPSIFVSGFYAYVATTDVNGKAILRVVDVSYPTNPYEVGRCNTPGQPEDIFVLGSYAYLAAGTAGLRVIDVSEPSKPHEVGYWDDMPTLAEANGVFVMGLAPPTSTSTPTPTATPTLAPPSEAWQGPAIQWNRTFGGANDDEGSSVQRTSDGGYIIVGYTESYGAGGSDIWLIKTDAQGNEVWDRTFGSADAEVGCSVRQTSDGGYIIAGYTYEDVLLIKTDAHGNKVWDRTFGEPAYEEKGYSVQQTSDGGYIVVGMTWHGYGYAEDGKRKPDALVIKTDAEGNKTWDRTFGGAEFDVGISVQQTSDGGYVMAGETWSFPRYGEYDAWLVKIDPNGNKVWDRTFGEPGYYRRCAHSVQQTPDGGYMIGGFTIDAAHDKKDVWLMKTDAKGNKMWDRTLGEPGYDESASLVQQTSDGGYIIVGYTESYGAGGRDIWLIKTDTKGYTVWDGTFGGAGLDVGASVQQTSDGGYVLVGYTESYGAGGHDVWLILVGGAGAKTPETSESAGAATPTPVSVVDDAERTVEIAETPQRIVSLAPSNTEILFALGLGDKVVGVTDFCDYPEEVKAIEKVGGIEPNLEKIVDLDPDLVLAIGGSPAQVERATEMEKLGLTVLVLEPGDIEGIMANIELVGQATGAEKEASELVAELRKRFDDITAKVEGAGSKPKVFFELDATDPSKPYTPGPGSFIDALITLAGGSNIGASAKMQWAQLSTEEIIAQDPEIIVLGDAKYGVTTEMVKERPGWEVITAVKNDAIYPIDDVLVSRLGPRIIDGLETLAGIIHLELTEATPSPVTQPSPMPIPPTPTPMASSVNPWPMYRHDAQRTGCTTYRGPEVPELKWSFQAEGRLSAPVIASDGTIYVDSEDGNLYAIDPSGGEKWTYVIAGEKTSQPAIGADGTIYVAKGSNLYAIRSNGTLKWTYSSDDEVYDLAIGPDGRIYIAGECLHAVSPDGKAKWVTGSEMCKTFGALATGQDGTIYGMTILDVCAFSSDGALKWEESVAPGVRGYNTSITLDPQGNIYVNGEAAVGASMALPIGVLEVLNPDGSYRFDRFKGEGFDGYIESPPVMAQDGTVYVSWREVGEEFETEDGRITAKLGPLQLQAATLPEEVIAKWSYPLGDAMCGYPVVGGDGTVYVILCNGDLFAVDSSGNLVWTFNIGESLEGGHWSAWGLAIGAGTLYVSSGSKLHAIGESG